LLENCLFDSNSAVNGGSIHIKVFEGSPANVSIINTTFSNNRAAQQGGAIYSNSGIIDIINSTFENNSCSGNGGAILTKKGLIQIFDSKFINNSAEMEGRCPSTQMLP
jgi:predicted outer membrane repeat protein